MKKKYNYISSHCVDCCTCDCIFSSVFSKPYYDELESYWHKIGALAGSGKYGLSYQTVVSGNLFGNGSLVAVSNYHHRTGWHFLHKLVDGGLAAFSIS